MKKLVVAMFILLLSIGLVACGENTVPEKVEPTVGSSNEPTIVEDKATTETFAIGDTVKMGNLVFTVNSARWDYGSEFLKPNPGEKWLVIDCTLENTSDKPTSVSSLMMFSLFDEDSYTKDLEFFANTNGSLDGELGVGRKMRGEIAFNVAETQNSWEFIFEPNLFGFGQAIYIIEGVE